MSHRPATRHHGYGEPHKSHDAPTTVVGDHDPSGLSILDAAAEDVLAFVDQLGAAAPTITRLAVTPEQIRRYNLPTAPQKAADHRGAHMSATVQAEALPPDQLTAILASALDRVQQARHRLGLG
ncbi:hypothetical protein [Nonomuraea sp. NPDC046570]|uniref:hypothetical protein n=1 Tax=Nonomuraea sp. NPDC046570 TaxID=3155255 RepID=UPI0033E120E1